MPAIEVWGRRGHETVTLSQSIYIVGSDADAADVVIVDDPSVSGVHLILERIKSVWLVRDLGSKNGTKLNSALLLHGQEGRLRHTDEILAGRTRLVFRDAKSSGRPETETLAPPPANITAGEKRVLLELCRPLLTVARFTEPASRRQIAEHLFVGQAAVQAHLTRLYRKFGIYEEPGVTRRVALANEAFDRGAVTLPELEALDRGAIGREGE